MSTKLTPEQDAKLHKGMMDRIHGHRETWEHMFFETVSYAELQLDIQALAQPPVFEPATHHVVEIYPVAEQLTFIAD